jgi:hypothetical protein
MKKILILTISLLSVNILANSCYNLDSSDREACLGNAYSTNNKDARNIILGNCYSLSNYANNNGLRSVCINGKDGCYSLNNSSDISSCVSCNGSNKWARVYATGNKLSCY